jgi:putative intracellular protease/amidase
METFPRRWTISLPMIGLLLAWGLAGPLPPVATAAEPPPLALRGLDPVLLIEGKEEKGRSEISSTRARLRYQFVNAANKATFDKDPQRHAIQLDGDCPMHRTAAGLPDIFTVYKGRIYCFACEDCKVAFQENPGRYLNRQSVVILIFDGMELLDFAGPAEVFKSAGFDVKTVAVNSEPVACAGLITLTPHYTLANCPDADIIVVPGGSTAVSRDKRVTDWVAQASGKAKATLSVCTGVFVLARAGLLDGKAATTHHGAIEALRKLHPKITVHADRRIVDNGSLVTAAGVSAGIDGALHLVDRLRGRDEARAAARYMEYNWQPTAVKSN